MRIGESLVKNRIIKEDQLKEALRIQVGHHDPLGKILVELGHCLEEDISIVLADLFQLPYIELERIKIDKNIIQSIPVNLAIRYKIIPFKIENNTLHLACSKPLEQRVISNLRRIANRKIIIFITTDSIIGILLKRYHFDSRPLSGAISNEEDVEQSVISVLNDYISKALIMGASDIHVEPQKNRIRVRFRIDGVLNEMPDLPHKMSLSLISRIKILSELDISEKRSPQDGSFIFSHNDETVDVRTSILPNIHGEKAVLRLLSTQRRLMSLESLGMEEDTLQEFRSLLSLPHGIILITGPTGSGKTTTLYASLQLIRSVDMNITTIENPVECQIEGITQVQVDHAHKITFASALRHILRQDPDIIMVGEIRDKETAEIALRAALTGHLVFATLHTNDASSALTRLIDMGCEPYLISSTICGIVAQRFIRLNCEHCRTAYSARETQLKAFNVTGKSANSQWFFGRGCRHCHKTGFKGRIGIFELLKMSNDIRQEVVRQSTADKIKNIAISRGMRSLRQDGYKKILRGITSPEEILRVTASD